MNKEELRAKALAYHKDGKPGKITVNASKPCETAEDLALAYTPGVAQPCLEIREKPETVWEYTSRGNLVAVVSDGTAVLGLGNIGPEAGLPVMEGKAVLFKRFADIDSVPICLGRVFNEKGRSDAAKIEFTMQDPCKRVNVSLPCSFTDGTVKLGETEILDAEFDGQTVSFQTEKAGTYVIESKTPVQPKPDDAITGIISGIVASGALQPGAPVTREQLCAILCRYAALTGKNTAASASLDAFTDRAQVSAYAEASVRWALQAGLLTGVGDSRLAPRSGATRAQLAVLLQRFAGLK